MPRFLKMTLVTALILLPTSAFAQSSSITGVVKDSSGGVVPGVMAFIPVGSASNPNGQWLVPTTVLTARSTKITLQWDF